MVCAPLLAGKLTLNCPKHAPLPGRGTAGDKPRFVITSLPTGCVDARHLDEEFYCARDDMENRTKECQFDLFADRTSAATMRANQLRLSSPPWTTCSCRR